MSQTAPAGWQIGDELPAQTLEPITRLQLIKYAGASGDYNPIHTIDQAAAQSGLPGVIAHGMLTMATIGRLVSPYLDRGFVPSFETRFTGMVFVGDTLTISGRVTAREQTATGYAYTFEVFAKNQRDQ
ncbi:MAG TPA: MaoC/PaaZ C-terminal domain-containing protein, partial [Chloroflexota bacterium]|nr:MaoC/PaaZ C-terminal domain-containing protein [Chloroflexota bacterium]